MKEIQHDESKQFNSEGTCTQINEFKTNAKQSESIDDSHKIRRLKSLAARKNPFADLVRISILLNPREYELPEDYVPDIQFPGTSKKTIISMASREARHTSYSVKRAQELDRNNLPLILRTCYFCRKGCRKAPLIHCDYCPLVYHADCIDPPLTILPNTRWMCPNHVEPIAEEKLLSSSSFCERVKLWNHFSKPIDHESIKISFLDKVHSSSSPEPEGSEYVKLACRVPKRIKSEYSQFIVNVEKYEGESDEDCNELTEGFDEQRSSTLNVYLRQMIDSSKILESQGKQSTNGENDSRDDTKSTSLDQDTKEKEEWLEFLRILAKPEIRGNNLKSLEAAKKSSSNNLRQQQQLIKSGSLDSETSTWPNNSVLNSQDYNHSFQHQPR